MAGERSKPAPFEAEAPALPDRIVLSEAVGAGAEEFEEAQVAQNLELLADFVADVSVLCVEFCQSLGMSVDIRESEIHFA